MEVVEHVADVDLFIEACGQMVKPGGLMFIATINRTLKALGLAIFGAEYVLRWLPRGTHQYEKLVRPEELTAALGKAGMDVAETTGVFYNPLTDSVEQVEGHGCELYGAGGQAGGVRRAAS